MVAEDEEAPELADVEGQCAKGCFTSYMACMRVRILSSPIGVEQIQTNTTSAPGRKH